MSYSWQIVFSVTMGSRWSEWKFGFLLLSLSVLLIAGRMFVNPQAYRDSEVAPFAQAPLWALRATAIVFIVGGLYLFYRFLAA